MIRLVWIILIGLVLSIHIQSERDQERNIESQLVFFDEFDGNSLDLGKWDTIPRWGRTDESFSEDPYLTGIMVKSFVKGIQGDDPNYWMAASLLSNISEKHSEA